MLEVISDHLLAYQEDRLKSYQKINQSIKSDGIVFAGDSIIEFFPLKKYLGRNLPLYNRGIAGIDTYFLEKHMATYLCPMNAKQLFLLIGTNDLGLGHSISEIRGKVVDIIADFKAANSSCQIYLISVLPVSNLEKYASTVKVRSNETIDQLNLELATIPDIFFLSVANFLKNNQNALDQAYTKDGLHLNMAGYERLSELLRPYLK
ncbi:GDSL-type esterase/lipase family protein [Streptococcus castoreus]|uniref:GDSL-type esterase/lipase family protein n=1 Tax=Streptococcus castoreus TaxID=254786 RepID=UPI00040D600E|nr:GDSL-type esterase/lipase family protein [Streptococcus castoreus]